MSFWPNFFIAGAAKAGTTSLYYYLKDVPGISMSRIKEPSFFSREIIPKNFPYMEKIFYNEQDYLKLFEDFKNSPIRGEASPTYLSDPLAAKLIQEKIPDAKILISLRDPVERAYSHYWMLFSRTLLKMQFSERIQLELKGKVEDDLGRLNLILENSMYYENVKRFLELFGNKQIKIIIFEDLIKNPKLVLEDILKFLGIEFKLENLKTDPYNTPRGPRGEIAESILKNKKLVNLVKKTLPSKTRQFIEHKVLTGDKPKPRMDENDRKFLQSYFKEDVDKLKNLLGLDVPWRNFQN